MQSEILLDYMKKAQALAMNSNPEFLLELVDREMEKFREEPSLKAFFQGEHNFYSKKYRQALENYLEAKDIPNYQFFCFRASAYLSKEIEEQHKALTYANKANTLIPEDYLTLKILNALYSKEDSSKEALQVREKLSKLEKGFMPNPEICKYGSSVLTEEDFNELLSISQGCPHEELFQNDHNEENTSKLCEKSNLNFIKETSFQGPNKPAADFPVPYTIEKPLFQNLDIEMKLDAFANRYRELLEDYVRKAENRSEIPDLKLFTFNVWTKDSKDLALPSQLANIDEFKCGIFFRFNGKGIAVNPGHSFLELLEKRNLTILDIDSVIITHSKRDLYPAVTRLYELNTQLNRVLGRAHPIHFYFNRSAFQEMIQILKPQYRQEKSTLHCLELYLDTPDVETLSLHEGIKLHYFQIASSPSSYNSYEGINLGIKFELSLGDDTRVLSYVSSSPWTPHLADYLKGTDLLMLGFGTTSHEDLTKERYREDCLGYFGCLSLFEEVLPSLCILAEFDQKVAGARLEICKHLRNELFDQTFDSTLLLADPNLEIDLNALTLRCTITSTFMNPSFVKIVQGSDPFKPLQFLSQASYI